MTIPEFHYLGSFSTPPRGALHVVRLLVHYSSFPPIVNPIRHPIDKPN